MGFFKFMGKKGKGEGHRDLNSEMTMDDIPPAPEPFNLGERPPRFDSGFMGRGEFPGVPSLNNNKEAFDLPTFPETIGPEIRAPPAPKIEMPSSEKTFEDIPFPGIKHVDDHPEHEDPFPHEIHKTAPVSHEHIVSPPPEEHHDMTPPIIHVKNEPRIISPPPVPEHKVETPHIKKHEVIEEYKKEVHPLIQQIQHELLEKKNGENVEFKYLKERTNVDFGKPLFLDSYQCNKILDSIDAMRRGLSECSKSYDHLGDLRTKSDKQFQKMHSAVEEVQKKLFNADKILFNQ